MSEAQDPAEGAAPQDGSEAGALKAALAEREAESKGLLDQLLRLKAEFENYRRRVDREKADLVRFGKAELLARLLPLYDLLLTAHGHLQEHQADGKAKPLAEGMELIFKEFNRLFEAEGVRPMAAVGKPFDPHGQEALGAVETADQPDGSVVDELQRGYMLGDRVLRPAKVRIAKAPAGNGK